MAADVAVALFHRATIPSNVLHHRVARCLSIHTFVTAWRVTSLNSWQRHCAFGMATAAHA